MHQSVLIICVTKTFHLQLYLNSLCSNKLDVRMHTIETTKEKYDFSLFAQINKKITSTFFCYLLKASLIETEIWKCIDTFKKVHIFYNLGYSSCSNKSCPIVKKNIIPISWDIHHWQYLVATLGISVRYYTSLSEWTPHHLVAMNSQVTEALRTSWQRCSRQGVVSVTWPVRLQFEEYLFIIAIISFINDMKLDSI